MSGGRSAWLSMGLALAKRLGLGSKVEGQAGVGPARPAERFMAKGKTVLIAEDEPDIRGLVVYSLEYAGYRVIQARNGHEAVALAEREQPDLILLDARMPKMDGYEACAALRARESTRAIPVVFLSARGQETEIKHGLDLGAEEYIVKPFGPDELNQRVDRILERLGRK